MQNKYICRQSYNHRPYVTTTETPTTTYFTVQKQIFFIPRLHTLNILHNSLQNTLWLLCPNNWINSVTSGRLCVPLLTMLSSLSVIECWCIIGGANTEEPQVLRHGTLRWNVTEIHYLFHLTEGHPRCVCKIIFVGG